MGRRRPIIDRRLTLAIALAFRAVCAAFSPALGDEIPFPVGEIVRGRLVWGPFTVGTAEFVSEWTDTDPPVIRLTARARTVGFFDRLFRIENEAVSVIDPDTLLPVSFEKHLREGDWRQHDRLEFDRAAGLVRRIDLLEKKENFYAAPPGIHDVLSFMYSLRRADFRSGRQYLFDIAGDEGVIRLHLRVGDRRTWSHDSLGHLQALVLYPAVTEDRLFMGRRPKEVWISAELPHLLLRMIVQGPVGTVQFRIEEVGATGR